MIQINNRNLGKYLLNNKSVHLPKMIGSAQTTNISDPRRKASEIEKHLKSENLEEIKHFRARNKIKDEAESQRTIWRVKSQKVAANLRAIRNL
jgi:hypothetical protein